MSKPSRADELLRYVRGYPKLAGQMGMLPETAIFRRFGALNARDLLYLQSGLAALEVALMKAEKRNSQHPKWEKQVHARNWYWIEHSALADDEDKVRYNLIMRIREKLGEYNEASYYPAAIIDLKEPDRYDMRDIQHFLFKEKKARPFIARGRTKWGSFSKPDSYAKEGLVTLRPRECTGSFSTKLSEYWIMVIYWFKRLLQGRNKIRTPITIEGYRDSTVSKITFWLMSVLASSISVISIIMLVNIKSLKIRLAAIAGFN